MSAPGWHPDPEAPPGPPTLTEDEIERLAEWLASGQKRHDRARLEQSLDDWYDPEEIEADTRLLLRALVDHLPVGERPLELRRGARRPLLALTAHRLYVVKKLRSDREEVEIVSAPHDRLDLRVDKHGQVWVEGDAPRLAVSLPLDEWQRVSAFLADPPSRVDRVGQVLVAARRPPDAAAPGWYPDPTGRHAERFWDGYRWADEGLGDPLARAQLHPPPGPPALDDATIGHIVEGLTADRVRDDRSIALADAYGTGGRSMGAGKYGWHMDRLWRALQPQFPAGDPPCDFRDDLGSFLVVSAHRLAVVTMVGDRPVLDVDQHDRVELTKARTFGTGAVRREHGRLLVPTTPVGRKWVRDYLTGPRTLQGQLQELLARPRRSPGDPRAGWFPDPTGRYHQRFWTGAAWTAEVISMKGGREEQRTDKQFR